MTIHQSPAIMAPNSKGKEDADGVASPRLSLFSNAYVEELCNNVRNRPVPWEGYQRAGLFTEHDLASIKAIDKVGRSKRMETVQQNARKYASLTATLVHARRVDIIQWTCVVTSDLCLELDNFLKCLVEEKIYDKLLKQLQHEDPTVPILAAKLLSTLLPYSDNAPLTPFLNYFSSLIKSGDSNLSDLALQSYASLFSSPAARREFWQRKDARLVFEKIQESNGNIQILYHALVVIWELTFDTAIAEELDSECDVILVLREVAKTAIKEKILRMVVAILRNIVRFNAHRMLAAELLPLLNSLKSRKWSDQEIEEDLSFLTETLQKTFDTMTTLDSYLVELDSGHLRWSPPHKSKTFWSQNGRLLTPQHLEKLSQILKTSTDDTVLAVCCSDVQNYLSEVPSARKKLIDLGVKTRVMELMVGGGKETRYEALSATQAFVRHSFA